MPGLIDSRVFIGEPGGEHRETIASASLAAAAGGVTSIVMMPDTDPVIDDIALVEHRAAGRAATRRWSTSFRRRPSPSGWQARR